MEMKIAAAEALAELAREDVPDEVAAAYQGARPRFGREYIIPVPFDPRLISRDPDRRWRKAAMDTGVARRPIVDMRRLQGAALRAGAIRSPARSTASSSACARSPSAWSSPRARRSR